MKTMYDGDKLSPEELDIFLEAKCPDCNQQKLLEGPSGGLCTNYMCDGCGSKFNYMGVFGVERISDKQHSKIK